MSQRLKVKEMVMQMHEKNLVLMNILRDIAENETLGDFAPGATARCLADRATRRAKIFGEFVTSCIRKTWPTACRHKPQFGKRCWWAPAFQCVG
ncbi:hypothetical protein AMC90_PD00955 (plasmid) [Rhizobium phaseoli]|uniref:hypothetical protein n=1 Tax=Rhizobium phaseoli TaxID=396 RepID=UPI0003820AE2|nr:hypothetical protein [Rhizobium phaseoli]ANL31980.1 hypothetical protein AMC90_PD00955 [Rhizobium phaseoli]KKZ84184.1 hypothetical protein RPHASCH2410_PD04570 [Rhizobium phaseoli Ch24-10]RDJ04730.1 hypothetical protein B5K04_23930 [Rhizobium phaseoli]RDJ06983.1 hypothetical protein B5K05_23995 [Rhizobium phaseoli]